MKCIYCGEELKEKIVNYDKIVDEMGDNYTSNNKKFVKNLEDEIKKIF